MKQGWGRVGVAKQGRGRGDIGEVGGRVGGGL